MHTVTSKGFAALLGLFLVALTSSAHASSQYIYFHDDVYRTVIWAAVILSAGMIISALILKKSRNPKE